MEETHSILGSLIEKAEAYFITSLELVKLKLTQKYTAAMSAMAFKLIFIILGSILFNVFSIGAGLWLGELLGKLYYGFFAVSLLYLVLILALHLLFKKWIRRVISSSILKHLL